MPAEFQKAFDYTFVGLKITHCFLVDIFLIISCGSLQIHMILVYDWLQKKDVDNYRINIAKCRFGKAETEWLEYRFNQSGILPLENETAAILSLIPTTTLTKLRSILVFLSFKKILPKIASLGHPFRTLLKKATNLFEHDIWTRYSLWKNQTTISRMHRKSTLSFHYRNRFTRRFGSPIKR